MKKAKGEKMKDLKGRLLARIFWLITCIISILILALIFNIIIDKLLRAGYLELAGTSQFYRVLFGWPLFFLTAFSWLALFIWSGHYYTDGIDKGLTISRFLLVSAVEMYCFPLFIGLYQLIYQIGMTRTDWIIISTGLLTGSLLLLLFLFFKK